jgi:GAF domain/Adenylate and Guanylate cyclase catalytic domain
MNRRSKAGSEPTKRRRPKTPKPTGRSAPKVGLHSKTSSVAEENEAARLARERDEALEQQTATSEVLRVISASPGELELIFQAMLERAVRVCGAKFGNIYRWDGEALHIRASHNTPPAFVEAVRRSPYRPYPHSPVGRMLADRTVAHIRDVTAEEVFLAQRDPMAISAVELGGIRTLLGVPLLNKGEMIGAFFLSRQEVRPFTDKQIALVQNFAAQAVIAIENARLLNELRQRTTDLSEALEQQTATSNVLQVISSSPGNLEPVFATMLENAVRLCDAKFGSISRWDGEALHLVATYNVPPAFAEFRKRTPFRPGPENPISQMLMTKTVIHFHDLATDQGYIERNPTFVAAVELGGEALGASIIKYSGTLERYAGDGVMVVFNDPVPVENPALQAVLMALEMREAIGALTETWRRWGHEIGFGIGIAHGFATLGTIGFEGRFDYAAIGTVSNVASRLCDEAKPGQILISPRVLTKVAFFRGRWLGKGSSLGPLLALVRHQHQA